MASPGTRPLRPEDLNRVAEIERQIFADPWPRRAFADALREPHICAFAVDNAAGEVAGYGLCSIVADEGEILNLAVDVTARGQGLGRLLLEGMVGRLGQSGVAKVYLEVRRSNEAAIGLYRAAGFTPLGVRPSYYEEPREDALTMALELGSQTARK